MKFLQEFLDIPPILYVKDDRHYKILSEAFRKLGFVDPIKVDDLAGARDAVSDNPDSLLAFEWIDNEATTLLNHMKGDAFFDSRPIIVLAESPSKNVNAGLSEFRVSFTRFGKQEAKTLLEDVVNCYNPEHPVNSLVKAFRSIEHARQDNNHELVVLLLGALVDKYPKNLRLQAEYAAAKIRYGEADEAEDILDELLILNQYMPRVHYLKYECHKKRGELQEGVKYLKESIKLNNCSSYRISEYGNYFLEGQDSDKAKKYFIHAWKLDNKHEATYKGLATTKLLEGDFKGAAKYLKRISDQKERASALNLAGVTAVKKGSFHLADKMYHEARKFVDDKPILAKVIYNQALAAAQLKMKKETTQFLKQAYGLDPTYTKVTELAEKLKLDITS